MWRCGSAVGLLQSIIIVQLPFSDRFCHANEDFGFHIYTPECLPFQVFFFFFTF